MKNIPLELYSRYKYYIAISGVVYLLSAIVGILIGLNANLSTSKVSLTYWNILLNNLGVGLLIIGVGLVTLGIGSVLIVAFNGFNLGYIVSSIINTYGIYPIMSAIVPHFIPEMMATFLCCAVGFESRIWISGKLSNNCNKNSRTLILKITVLMLFIILFLFAIAAWIETNISYY